MNSILFDFHFIQIRWYSILLLVSFIIGGYLALKEAKKQTIPESFMIDMFFYLIPIAFVGARLYYVIFNWDYFGSNLIDILKVWQGGLAIHGGLIASILFLFFYTKKRKVNLWKVLDILVVSLILGQAIGRWGNFFNGEAYGPVVTLDFLKNMHLPDFIIQGMQIDGVYYQPTFLYESIWDISGFILLLLFRHYRNIKTGQLTGIYMIWYGIGRLFIESLRMDSLMWGNIRVAQLISIIMILIGVVIVIIRIYSERYHEGREKYEKRI